MLRTKNASTAPVVLLLLSTLAFLTMLYWNLFASRIFHWVGLIIALMPVLFFAGYYAFCRRRVASGARRWAVLAFSLLFVFVTMLNAIVCSTIDSLSPSTDTFAYPRILRSYGYPTSRGVAHFPQRIPRDAQDVFFYEEPSFGPSGCKLVLRYRTDAATADALLNEYRGKEQKTLDSGEYSPDNLNMDDDAVRNMIAEPLDIDTLPEEYELVILGRHAEADSGGAYGIAADKSTGTVLFWYVGW